MNNLEYLFAHDRWRILRNLTMEDHPCRICPKYDADNPWCNIDGRCSNIMREWLMDEHVDANDDLPPENDISVGSVDANDENDTLDSREKLEAEVRKWCGMYPYQVDMVWVWLNRQAAITTNQLTSKSDVLKPEETAENATSKCDMRDFGDSREKLEADMRERLGELWADAWDAGNRDSMDDNFDLSVFIALLDRQATIAQDETIHTYNLAAREARKVQEERIAELESELRKFKDMNNEVNAECSELQEQIAEQRKSLEIAWDDNCKLNDAITKRRAEVNELKAERDHYRELCGKLLDAADDMRRVRDAFDQFERGEA